MGQTGEVDGAGAFQINIPVAYTPGRGYVAASVYGGAHVGGPVSELGNGSGVLSAGFFRKHKVFVSAMKVSHLLKESFAVSGQVGLVEETPSAPAVAIGQQDLLGKEPDGESPYVVVTKSARMGGRTVYATLGYGGGRFIDKPFGGLSIPLAPSFNLAVEHDGFQLNGGLGWRPGGRHGKVTLLGAYNGKCGWMLGVSAAGYLPTR